MATDQGIVKSASPARGDAFVAERLTQAEQRIRILDLTTAGLGFLAGTCAYAAAIIIADHLLAKAEVIRELLFLGYVVGAVAYLIVFIGRPLTRRINPYFAARQVEQTLPGAKNSVVNWIDLHDQPLPPAIRNALGLRAAKDIARSDLAQAISSRRTGFAGGLAAIFVGILFFLLVTQGGGPFFDGLARAFAPFHFNGPSRTRTRLTLVRPESGDATVPVGRSTAVTVAVEGKLPDPKGPQAIRLLYRYQEDDPWLERMMQEETQREFTATLTAAEVQSGFWYKVAGGDAETAEYRISVRSTPQLTDFQATYHFPQYAAIPKETRRERILRAVRGSEVVLWALTNRAVQSASLDFEDKEGRKTFTGQRVDGDPKAFQVRLPLQESGLYRLSFTSVEGDTFSEQQYPVEVLADLPPEVQLTKPGKEISLPANGLLALEGRAADDFGVRELVLRMKAGEQNLKSRPYRSAEALHLSGGGYPLTVVYKDSVDLLQVEGENGAAFHPQAGTEIEYWLEASDACEPKANVGSSKHYRVKLTEPQKDKAKQQQDREQAKKDQQKHEAKQDEQLKQEDTARREQEKKEDKQEKQKGDSQGDSQGNGDKGNGAAGDQSDKNNGTGTGKNDQPDNAKEQPQGKGGSDGDNSPDQAKQDQENREKAQRLKDALNKSQNDQGSTPDNKNGGKKGDNQQSGGSDKNQNQSDPSQSSQQNKADSPKNGPGDKGSQSNSDATKSGDKAGDNKTDMSKGSDEKSNQTSGQKSDRSEPKNNQANQEKPDSNKDKNTNTPDKSDNKPNGSKDQTGKDQSANGTQKNQKPNQGNKQPGNQQNGDKNQGNQTSGQQQSPADAKPQGKDANANGAKDQTDQPKPAGDKGQQSSVKNESKADGSKNPNTPQTQNGSQTKPEQTAGNETKDAGKNDKGDNANTNSKNGEQNSGEKTSQGTPQSTQSKDDKRSTNKGDNADGESKQDNKSGDNSKSQSDAQNATSEDVSKSAKDLLSNDPKKREEAAKKLDQMSKQAKDEGVREEAHKALESGKSADKSENSNSGQKGQQSSKDNSSSTESKSKGDKASDSAQPGSTKSPEGKSKADDESGKSSAKPDSKDQGASEKNSQQAGDKEPKNQGSKPGEKPNGNPGEKSEANSKDKKPADNPGGESSQKPGDKGEKPGEPGQKGKSDKASSATAKDKTGKPGAGETPGQGAPDGVRNPENTTEPPAPGPAPNPQKGRHLDKDSVLQLEDLDKVTKKELDAAKLTEKDLDMLRQWLREQKQKAKIDPKETAVAPQRGGPGAMGGNRVQPGTGGKPNDLSGDGRALPPPGYREANEAFKRLINKPDADNP